MNPIATRPEDRQRAGRDGLDWADTQPLFHRSEAFAEDLGGTEDDAMQTPATPWLRTASMPLLGMALSTLIGLFGR